MAQKAERVFIVLYKLLNQSLIFTFLMLFDKDILAQYIFRFYGLNGSQDIALRKNTHNNSLIPMFMNDVKERLETLAYIESIAKNQKGILLVINELEQSIRPKYIYKPQCIPNASSYSVEVLKKEFELLELIVENGIINPRYRDMNAFLGLRYYHWEIKLYEYYCRKIGLCPNLMPIGSDKEDSGRIRLSIPPQKIKAYFLRLIGPNADGDPIMNETDLEQLLHANFEGFYPQKSIIPIRANVSTSCLRYFLYCFYRKYETRYDTAWRYVRLLHQNFLQFAKSDEENTKKNFSKKPNDYYLK